MDIRQKDTNDQLEVAQIEISNLHERIKQLEKILYDTTSLTGWLLAGYSIDEYDALRDRVEAREDEDG
jgi:hypothetical protein